MAKVFRNSVVPFIYWLFFFHGLVRSVKYNNRDAEIRAELAVDSTCVPVKVIASSAPT